MVLLEHELGLPLAMLERPSEQPPDGAVRIRTPDEFWFQSFSLVAEMPRAIIVIGTLGVSLIHELRYLREAVVLHAAAAEARTARHRDPQVDSTLLRSTHE